jgi:hypothetical protein
LNVNNCPARCDCIEFYYIFANGSTCFGWYLHPSSGAHVNCNYSIWHCLNCICYLLLSWRIRNESSDSSMTTEGSKYVSTSARCCNYSLNVLLMMDEGIIQNRYSYLQKYNKLCVVVSYWQIIDIRNRLSLFLWSLRLCYVFITGIS